MERKEKMEWRRTGKFRVFRKSVLTEQFAGTSACFEHNTEVYRITAAVM